MIDESLIQKLENIEFDGSDRRGAEVFRQAKLVFLHVIKKHKPEAMGGVPVQPEAERHSGEPSDSLNRIPAEQGDAPIVQSPPASDWQCKNCGSVEWMRAPYRIIEHYEAAKAAGQLDELPLENEVWLAMKISGILSGERHKILDSLMGLFRANLRHPKREHIDDGENK